MHILARTIDSSSVSGLPRTLLGTCLRPCQLWDVLSLTLPALDHLHFRLGRAQIEYIIVAFHDATKNAYLALSQTEILIKLAGVVMDMECGKESVNRPQTMSSAPQTSSPLTQAHTLALLPIASDHLQ